MLIKIENKECTPVRAHPTDAGLDLRCKINTILPKNKRVLVGTGVSVKIPVGYVGLLVPRSSLSKNNIVMTNSIGIIDADYRGEILASLQFNGLHNLEIYEIPKGERIVQLVVVPVLLTTPTINEDWTDEVWFDTNRGAGGFGSTGKG